MKFNYKKVATILGSALMLGATVGMAAAASFTPSSFSSDGIAIVVGTNNAAPSDTKAALDLTANLVPTTTSTTTSTVTGGDSFKLEKTSDKFYFNEALNSAFTSLDKDELEIALADGTYDSGDIDVDYEQSISLGSNALSLFADSKYASNVPTVGFWFTNGQNILNYTMTFDDGVNETQMAETKMPLLGNSYYVLSATDSKITLLDSADSLILSEGETKTVGGKTVSIEYISSTSVKFNIDGEVTDSMSVGNSKKLNDGSYVVLTENMYAQKDAGISKVEFSIGSGKIILEDGKDVIIGEDSNDEIDGLVATVTGASGEITAVGLRWNSKSNTFLTEANPAVMPGLGKISLIYNGLTYAADPEAISLDNGETLTLNMANYDIPLMWYNGTDYAQGEENYPLKIAASSYTYAAAGYANASVMFWEAGAKVNTSTLATNALALQEDDRFIVTRIDQDLSDAETLYYEVSTVEVDGTTVTVELDDLIGSRDLSFTGTTTNTVGDTDEAGDVTATLRGFSSTNTTVYLNFSAGTDTITFNKAVSEKGLVVTIPTAAEGASVVFTEADKDDDLAEGDFFVANVYNSTNDKLYASLQTNNVSKEETLVDNKYTAMVTSDLATKISTDESGDEYELDITYYGKEAVADVEVVVGGSVSSVPTTGVMTVTDATVADAAGKNLIVIGGSCVNSVAAELLGGAKCGDSFTVASGVKAGEALVKSFARSGKTALLVAGYNADDTTRAVTYVSNNAIDTTVGKALKVTSANTATAIVA